MDKSVEMDATSVASLEALDLALEDLDLDAVEDVVEEAVVAEQEEIKEVLAEDTLQELDRQIEIAESYEAQTAVPGGDPSTKPAAASGRRSGAARKAAAPRTPRDLNSVPAEFFQLDESQAGEDPESIKVATIALKPTQVKVAEKFENLFTSLSVGKAPSTYVMIAFKLLDANKTVTSMDIVAAYKASGLGEGTARSQSGQIMNLFSNVGIATRSGQTLTLAATSTLAKRLRSLTTPAA